MPIFNDLAFLLPFSRARRLLETNDLPLRDQVLSLEQLADHAREFARSAQVAPRPRRVRRLSPRLAANGAALTAAHRTFAAEAGQGQMLPPAAEWLLDNFYIVQDQLREVRQDLSSRYYTELPKFARGAYAGYPRVYGLALELIAHTDSHLDAEVITRFVQAYQTSAPLQLGELWAVPIMLRFGLIDNLRRLIVQSLITFEQRVRADRWADRFIQLSNRPATEFLIAVTDLAGSYAKPSPVFAVQFLQRLRDQAPAVAPAIRWLEQSLAEEGTSIEQVILAENQRRATNRVSVGNVITSMRALSAVDWRAFVQETSLVERVLQQDPNSTYAEMDFATRDRYRHAVERLARHSPSSEMEVAQHALALAYAWHKAHPTAQDRRQAHVGFYLIDRGVRELETRIGYRPDWSTYAEASVRNHPALFYFGAIALATLMIVLGLAAYANAAGTTVPRLVLSVLISLIPMSALVVSAINWTFATELAPNPPPKLEFDKEIPEAFRTMVVVPALVSSKEGIRHLLEGLELRFLANREPHLHWALLGDYADSTTQRRPEDQPLLDQVVQGVRELNARYGEGKEDRFYFFHRERGWNPRERMWMGWERKRGKLEEFNRLLRGGTDTSYIVQIGDLTILPQIKYVITLDADTQLPPGSAKRLVGTIAHPLNRAHLDPATRLVVQGYGIIQPRTGVAPIASARSRFAEIYAGEAGLDPYSAASSLVYQDFFGSGIYVGKAIYDVDAFHAALDRRFPENWLLSHDLLEGAYVRVGAATDIQLLEDFPSGFDAYAQRQHRWIRGDWQIVDWLLPRVPLPLEENEQAPLWEPNPLPLIERWKIWDNIRRSLVIPASFLLILAGWTFLPGLPVFWTLVALLPILFLAFRSIASTLGVRPAGEPWSGYFWAVAEEIELSGARLLLSITFLPYNAYMALDAIARVLARRAVTQRNLLEWMPHAAVTLEQAQTLRDYVARMWSAPAVSILLFILVRAANPSALFTAIPLLALWFVSPFVAYWVSRPLTPRDLGLPVKAQRELRLIARRIWRFFEEFAGEDENWLPPDNYQEGREPPLAHQTSPTNIGFLFLSTLAAYDFGFITASELADRVEHTFATLERLGRFRGHFFNWYNTLTLEPLLPEYVSTADSGNLVASLIAFRHACLEIAEHPCLPSEVRQRGLGDTLGALESVLGEIEPTPEAAVAAIQEMAKKIKELQSELAEPADYIRPAVAAREDPLSFASNDGDGPLAERNPDPRPPEAVQNSGQVTGATGTEIERAWEEEARPQLSPTASAPARVQGLSPEFLDRLARAAEFLAARERALEQELGKEKPDDLRFWCERLVRQVEALRQECQWDESRPVTHLETFLATQTGTSSQSERTTTSQSDAALKRLHARFRALAAHAQRFIEAMDFSFLYEPGRGIFSVGYNLPAKRLDNSYYDLLASEARLASFFAIARGQVPEQHWLKLSRPLTRVRGKLALLSWGGTMFEYLLPPLLTRPVPQTLEYQTLQGVVKAQIEYARKRRVPWGVSESGFYAYDLRNNFQYRLFGVPELGLKRELGDNLVISPYSTFLALAVAPAPAFKNLMDLAREGAAGAYGYCEAIDYTPARIPKGERAGIVREYMSHHQAWSLVALDNLLNAGPMQQRFAADATVAATQLLLQERIPRHAPLVEPHHQSKPITTEQARPLGPNVRRYTTPHTPEPRTQLLSNGNYTVVLTNSGSGYSSYKDWMVTRWRQDATRDDWGSFCYVKDLENGRVWSVGYQPTQAKPERYQVVYAAELAEFHRRDGEIETRMEVIVSPESDAEIRRISLTNHSGKPREVELTSYAQVSLDTPRADLAHPAFSKLFVESEFDGARRALFFKRRPRAEAQPTVWAVHLLSGDDHDVRLIGHETDRAKFLGRGRTPFALDALHRPLTNTVGAVLDPVMSLRARVHLRAGETVRVSFITGAGESRQAVEALCAQYADARSVERAMELAYVHNQILLRHLGVTAEQAMLFQRLASRVLYPDPVLRAKASILARNVKGQSGLWAYGISGDYPIVLVRIGETDELGLAREALLAHEFWRMNHFTVDLVIVNEHPTAYASDVQSRLQGMIDTSLSRPWMDKPGGVFLRQRDQMPDEDFTLLETVARVILNGEFGSIADQLQRGSRHRTDEGLGQGMGDRSPGPKAKGRGTAYKWQDALPSLLFSNGLGGFAPGGREYIIRLDARQSTPAPWINVLANPQFGGLTSESGLGYTWAINSQINKLTPWSNDPVSDPPAEAIYLDDQDTHETWSPTPLPIREAEPYVIRHGAGYTIYEHTSHGLAQELTVWVPKEDPVKILRLKLRNRSGQTRRFHATFYAEWVLGTIREESQFFIVTERDDKTGALLARNPYNSNFMHRIAFADVNQPVSSMTADRTEFLGRNSSPVHPAGLYRLPLSGRIGAALDPCAAIQTRFSLGPNEEKEIIFQLGQGHDLAEVRSLIERYRDPAEAQMSLDGIMAHWDEILGTVEVRTPDAAFDLMLNRWLLYETLACRVWGRSAFYQSGGAYGFRDQLQDVMALVLAAPQLTREQILRSARHQFLEGDVQHWWHPPKGAGIRTHISDDYLWLPFATHHYITTTGDTAILGVQVPFLSAPLLAPGQEDAYGNPEAASPGSLYEHCCRALDHGLCFGAHGLPLMGSGDWNDGMNLVGDKGQGESVWLGWFLYTNLTTWAQICETHGDRTRAEAYRTQAEHLARALDEHGWDGEWYRRAYFDDGQPLGAAEDAQGKIDSVAQSWAIISDAAPPERRRAALEAVEKYLVREEDALILLLAPPFDNFKPDPGYIQGYIPGIRENGGQYTHAALWVVLAYVLQGNGDRAMQLFNLLNPINHAQTAEEVARYKVEPYVIAADVYANPQHVGRGGWTWYTGSAGWMYRIGVEEILGLKRRANVLTVEPCIPRAWTGYQLIWRNGATRYEITVENPKSVNCGVAYIELDGVQPPTREIPLANDGAVHRVRVVMG